MEIDKKLYSEIKEYCKANGIKVTPYINSLLKDAFNRERYGTSPFKEPEPIRIEEYEENVNEVEEEKKTEETPKRKKRRLN